MRFKLYVGEVALTGSHILYKKIKSRHGQQLLQNSWIKRQQRYVYLHVITTKHAKFWRDSIKYVGKVALTSSHILYNMSRHLKLMSH